MKWQASLSRERTPQWVTHSVSATASKEGNRFSDFVLSGEDMRSKIIDHLSKSLNARLACLLEAKRMLGLFIGATIGRQLSPGMPATFHFTLPARFVGSAHASIQAEGESGPIVAMMNSIASSSRAEKSIEYLPNNERFKRLLAVGMMQQLADNVTQLSAECRIVSPRTALVGVQSNAPEAERKTITECIESHDKLVGLSLKNSKFCQASSWLQLAAKKMAVPHDEGDSEDWHSEAEWGKQREDVNALNDYWMPVCAVLHLILRLLLLSLKERLLQRTMTLCQL